MQSQPILTMTVIAQGAVTALRFVSRATGLATAIAARPTGVSRSDGDAGDALPVDVLGTTVVVAENAIAVDGQVEVGTAGKARAFTVGPACGVAVTAAAADGDEFEVLLTPS